MQIDYSRHSWSDRKPSVRYTRPSCCESGSPRPSGWTQTLHPRGWVEGFLDPSHTSSTVWFSFWCRYRSPASCECVDEPSWYRRRKDPKERRTKENTRTENSGEEKRGGLRLRNHKPARRFCGSNHLPEPRARTIASLNTGEKERERESVSGCWITCIFSVFFFQK